MPEYTSKSFNDILLSRTRLNILSSLIAGSELEFVYLRDTLGLSDGNLSVQIKKLEEAGYIKVKKVFVERKPKTFCRITAKGRVAIENLAAFLGQITQNQNNLKKGQEK